MVVSLSTYLNNPVIRQCADKLRVRDYLMERGFGGLLNELLGVYERVEDIDWDALPDQFVLKLNVGCGHDPRNYSKASYGGHRASLPEQAVRRWERAQPTFLAKNGNHALTPRVIKSIIDPTKFLQKQKGVDDTCR